ncbi:HigA family addiction module antitoxin [Nesterenkonia ebinurensis]|uniref:HigA family addiction module antitoxin n=1 Tax=Nesterenkonia ebinurensis TaxID=2608252 RepID=UPI001CC6A605
MASDLQVRGTRRRIGWLQGLPLGDNGSKIYLTIHPGESLRAEIVDELGFGVSEAALRLGVSRVALSRVLNSRAAVSLALARRLARVGLGAAVQRLRSLQIACDLAIDNQKVESEV